MFEIIKRMKKRDERGFTLVELLIVIAIIAILAAIAIPQFTQYRQKALEGGMVSDAKNAATQLESLFSDDQSYAAANGTTCTATAAIGSATITASTGGTYTLQCSPGNTITITSDATTYTVSVNNANARSGRQTHTLTNAGVTSWK
ncbi:MAG: prepilin-type N-terminal cleavage/methylation domain-containing protein [Thermodesulfovibrionales bacterium]|jgi:type IV pilus assembly protein PilA|nr:prepilin-type N-terminal cleavage/methylation domain-containing protein [Thermodesulfovibrionales bacterium]